MKEKNFLILLFIMIAATSNAQNDEYTWHNFNTSNSGLLSNIIQTLEINPYDGSVWAAYPGSGGNGLGIGKLNNGTWTNYNKDNSGLPNNDIRAIATDHTGTMWFACYNAGVVKFDGTNWTLYNTSNSGIVGNTVTSIKIDSENNVWVGAYAEGIAKFNGTDWTKYTSANAPFQDYSCIQDIVIDKSDNVWVGIACEGGLAKLDVAGNWTTYSSANSGLIPYAVISSMIIDNSGNLWFGYINRDKISRFDGNTWVTYSPFIAANNSIQYNGFAIDAGGDIWCHTGQGLYEFSNGAWGQVIVPQFADTALSSINIANDTQGNLWWGSYSGTWTNNIEVCELFPIEGLVSEVDHHLVVSDEDAKYHWKNCITDQAIPEATTKAFSPEHSGTYAVDILKNGCSLTSTCFEFTHCEDIVESLVSTVDDHLVASEDVAAYQWIDCATGLAIPNATDKTFAPEVTGEYSVQISKDDCKVTSICTEFEKIIAGISSLEEPYLQVFPNPASHQVTIDLGKHISIATISIKAANGVVVKEGKGLNKKTVTLSTIDIPPGLYFVFIDIGSSIAYVKKLIIE